MFIQCKPKEDCNDNFSFIEFGKGEIIVLDTQSYTSNKPWIIDTLIGKKVWGLNRLGLCEGFVEDKINSTKIVLNIPDDNLDSFLLSDDNIYLNSKCYLSIEGTKDNGFYKVNNGKVNGKKSASGEWSISGNIYIIGVNSKETISLVW